MVAVVIVAKDYMDCQLAGRHLYSTVGENWDIQGRLFQKMN